MDLITYACLKHNASFSNIYMEKGSWVFILLAVCGIGVQIGTIGCYKIGYREQELIWQEALDDCHRYEMNMVNIETEEEYDAIIEYLQDNGGMFFRMTWHTIGGLPVQKVGFCQFSSFRRLQCNIIYLPYVTFIFYLYPQPSNYGDTCHMMTLSNEYFPRYCPFVCVCVWDAVVVIMTSL